MTRVDKTLTSRFELKYWLHPSLVPQLRNAIAPFTNLDAFAARLPNNRYTITSLYLDSPALDLHRATIEGYRNRFKLRVRYYDDKPSDPVFFEIKKRAEGVILKRRARATREAALAYLRGDASAVHGVSSDLEEFLQTASSMRAGPAVRVRYDREAYESSTGDPVRITMDTSLMYASSNHQQLSAHGPGWTPCPSKGVVLEIKFTDTCPYWVMDTVKALRLERTSVAKYVLCIDDAVQRGGNTFKLGRTLEA